MITACLLACVAVTQDPGSEVAVPEPAESTAPSVGEPVRLWQGDAPLARGDGADDVPTLTPYLPPGDRATGAAIVICPGGGYGHLAPHEGGTYAKWLNDLGVTAFVLKYRLGRHGYRHPVMLIDAARAMRTVRARATEWHVDPERIGIMGSSAGGHLASTLATHFDGGDPDADDVIERQSSRPDLGILCYAVITMREFGHAGSRRNLLGPEPTPELIASLSNEEQVTTATPPCFLWHTANDAAVPVTNSLKFAEALADANVPFALHVFPKGRHGLGLGVRDFPTDAPLHPWATSCAAWLRTMKFAALH